MINKVILIGRLTSDIDIRRTGDQIPYVFFTLAVNRQMSQDKTDFISCVAWRATAELMKKYLQKGSQIAVEGRIEVFRTEKNGNFETRTTVNVNQIVFLDKRTNTSSQTQEIDSNTIERQFKESDQSPKNDFDKEDDEGSDNIDFDSIKF